MKPLIAQLNESTTQPLPLVLRKKQLQKLLGLSDSTIYKMQKEGRFPPPIQLSKRLMGWLTTDVQEWLKERGAEARAERSEDAKAA